MVFDDASGFVVGAPVARGDEVLAGIGGVLVVADGPEMGPVEPDVAAVAASGLAGEGEAGSAVTDAVGAVSVPARVGDEVSGAVVGTRARVVVQARVVVVGGSLVAGEDVSVIAEGAARGRKSTIAPAAVIAPTRVTAAPMTTRL